MDNYTQKDYEEYLIKNPKYDSDWIRVAAQILSITDKYTDHDLAKYNSNQLSHILTIVKDNIDIALSADLNATQMQLIITAIKNNINPEYVNILNTPDIPYAVSNYIVLGLSEGFDDMISYIDYDPDQVYEIYCGYKNNVDVSKYNLHDIPAKDMALIRHALEIGKDASYKDGIITIQ